MSGSHISTYKNYVDAFLIEHNLDYIGLEDDYIERAGSVGIYPDVSYLLYKIASNSLIGKLVEVGAGLSTCIISLAVGATGKNFTTIESAVDWALLVQEILEKKKIAVPNIICTYEMKSPPVLQDKIDFMFVDGYIMANDYWVIDRIDSCVYYSDILSDAVVAFDDAQSFPNEIDKCIRSLPNHQDRTGIWYNPQQRDDRQIYLSIPKSKIEILDVINSCSTVKDL